MQRAPVSSSTARSVGYDPATRTLEVEFAGGVVYRYRPVPPAAWRALLAADSLGRHFNAHIKDRYPFQRLRTRSPRA